MSSDPLADQVILRLEDDLIGERELRRAAEKKMEALLKVIGDNKRCRGCDAEVYWIRTKAGRPAPYNTDGTSHFSNCPNATAFRHIKRGGPHASYARGEGGKFSPPSTPAPGAGSQG